MITMFLILAVLFITYTFHIMIQGNLKTADADKESFHVLPISTLRLRPWL